jgi:type IV secretory pathway ATPase VirB11/archaellum biosynthesis ATPase
VNAQPFLFLDTFLAPLEDALRRPDVTDLYINQPGEIWLETAQGIERQEDARLDDDALWRFPDRLPLHPIKASVGNTRC